MKYLITLLIVSINLPTAVHAEEPTPTPEVDRSAAAHLIGYLDFNCRPVKSTCYPQQLDDYIDAVKAEVKQYWQKEAEKK